MGNAQHVPSHATSAEDTRTPAVSENVFGVSPNPNPKSHAPRAKEAPVTHTTPPPPEGPWAGYALRVTDAARRAGATGAPFATPKANEL